MKAADDEADENADEVANNRRPSFESTSEMSSLLRSTRNDDSPLEEWQERLANGMLGFDKTSQMTR